MILSADLIAAVDVTLKIVKLSNLSLSLIGISFVKIIASACSTSFCVIRLSIPAAPCVSTLISCPLALAAFSSL